MGQVTLIEEHPKLYQILGIEFWLASKAQPPGLFRYVKICIYCIYRFKFLYTQKPELNEKTIGIPTIVSKHTLNIF